MLRTQLLPRLGRRRIAAIETDDVARLVRELKAAGYSDYTARNVLTVLGRIMGHAVRRGMIPANPVAGLERGERPRTEEREMRLLTTEEIGRLLDACEPAYLPPIATALFTGVRQDELLGLTWADVDLTAGTIRVRMALDRKGQRGPAKTEQARREVAIMPAVGRILAAHKLRSPYSRPSDFVFTTSTGGPLDYRNLTKRGLDRAMTRAGLDGEGLPRLRWHDLRHSYASMLVSQGHDVVFVSAQLGHARSSITLDVYSHLFDPADRAQACAGRDGGAVRRDPRSQVRPSAPDSERSSLESVWKAAAAKDGESGVRARSRFGLAEPFGD